MGCRAKNVQVRASFRNADYDARMHRATDTAHRQRELSGAAIMVVVLQIIGTPESSCDARNEE